MAATHTGAFPALVRRARAGIDDGLNVVVLGHPGAGLTQVAAELHGELSTDRHVLAATGVKAWQQASFSGLSFTSRAQASPGEAAQNSGSHALRAAVDELARAAGPTGVILVTRPEWLDAASVGALSQVSARAGVPVLTVVDSVALAARRVPLLDELRPGLQLHVPLLTFDQVFRLATERLQGAVEVETVARIRAESGGLHGIAQAMIDLGRLSGALVLADDVWHAGQELASDDIGAHLKHMLSGLTHSQVAVLQAIGAANIDGDDFVPAPGKLDDLAVLIEAGLVQSEGGRWEVFPPILEERMRNSHRLFLRGQLARATAGNRARSRPLFPPSAGRGRRDRPIGDEGAEAEAVAGQRLRAANRARAEHLHEAWDATRSAADALPLVVALQTSGAQHAEIEEVVSGTARDAASAEYVILLIWWAIYRALVLGDALAALTDLGHDADGFPAFRPLVTAAITHLRMVVGEALPDSAGIPDDPEQDFGLGRVARMDAMLFAGATRDALELAADVSGVRPVFAAQLVISGNIARMFDGSVEDGLADAVAALRRAEAAGNLGLMQAHAYTVMLGLFLRGRLVEARAFLDRALAVSTSRALHSPFQLGTVDLGVLVEALMGDEHAAAQLAGVAASLPRAPMPLPGMDAFAIGAALAPTGSEAPLEEAAAERLDKGHVLSTAFLAIAAHRTLPQPAFAARLRTQTSVCQSPLLQAIGDYAWADAEADTATVLRLADRFRAMGADVFAVAARGRAAARYFQSGQRAAALTLAQETWEDSEALGDGRIGLLRPLSELIGLSEREAEAVLMGSHGASNKEVADALGLSQRTVENRWYAAYSKAGIGTRAELVRACVTWLRPGSSEPPRPA